MQLVWTILVGFLIGFCAKFIMPGRQGGGFILTTLLGIIGSFIGTYLGQAIGLYAPGESAGFIFSIVGAVILILIAKAVVRA